MKRLGVGRVIAAKINADEAGKASSSTRADSE
jgi:hypothetical protein